jgi:8-oxo-dGTP pyrophosphatase MutT (NUDIX family)
VTEVNRLGLGTGADMHLYVSLCVMNPTGVFFDQSVRHANAGELRPGSWHWPGGTPEGGEEPCAGSARIR